jgi:hypothetical protein
VIPTARRTRRLAAAIGALCVVLGACSIPEDDSAKPIDSDLLPEFSPRPSICPDVAGSAVAVQIYAIVVSDVGRALTPFATEVVAPATPEAALRRLIECAPNTEVDGRQITTDIIGVRLDEMVPIDDDGNYEVRLLSTGEDSIEQLDVLPAAQILFTVTDGEFGGEVKGIRFTLDGEPLLAQTPGGDKSPTDVKRRDDYAAITPTTTTSTTTTTTTTTTTAAPEAEPEGTTTEAP